jgi:hypothetical protein
MNLRSRMYLSARMYLSSRMYLRSILRCRSFGELRPRRRLLASLLVGLSAGTLSLSACGMFPPADLQPPKVTFSSFAVNEVGFDRTRFTVRIAAVNPNRIDIPLANVRFGLSVFGQPLAAGTVPEQRLTLPAGASTEVPVEFTVATADVSALLRKVSAGPWPDAVWELKGTAHWGDSPFAIPFERRGDSDSLRRLRDLLTR